jgi:dTMP kinase
MAAGSGDLKSGLFITLEGGEGAGKSSVMARIGKLLTVEGHNVVVTREPGGTPLGEAVRQLLLVSASQEAIGAQTELLLFLAARAQHLRDVIVPALAEGKIVLCDRFNDSSVAYQGYGRQLGSDRVAELCRLACGGFEPSLTFLLDVDPKIGLARATAHRERDRLEREDAAFHRRVREGFLRLARQNPERIRVIDAGQPFNQVVDEILQELRWNPSSAMLRSKPS